MNTLAEHLNDELEIRTPLRRKEAPQRHVNMALLKKYEEAKLRFPEKGRRHPYLLTVANYGMNAGLTEGEIIADLLRLAPDMGWMEVKCAVEKAFGPMRSSLPWKSSFKATAIERKPIPRVRAEGFDEIVKPFRKFKTEDLLRLSPERPRYRGEWCWSGRQLVEGLYKDYDVLYIGDKRKGKVLPAAQWLKEQWRLRNQPHIIPNPLTGEQGLTKDGRKSYRADSCVAHFLFAVAEFDDKTIEEQVSFWGAMIKNKLPVAAVIYSGGNSLHTWMAVNCENREEWDEKVRYGLFDNYLIPLGADGSCKNSSRLSRMPGCLRSDTGHRQSLLYLNPEVMRLI